MEDIIYVPVCDCKQVPNTLRWRLGNPSNYTHKNPQQKKMKDMIHVLQCIRRCMKDINHDLQGVNIYSMEDIDHVPQCNYKQVLNSLKSLTANSKADTIKHIYQ